MTPEGTRVLRRERRKAWRGIPRGRRPSHLVKTTFGRGQERAARLASWAAYREQEASQP